MKSRALTLIFTAIAVTAFSGCGVSNGGGNATQINVAIASAPYGNVCK